MAPTMRDRAIELAQQGFSVFPLAVGAKSPPIIPAGFSIPPGGDYHDHIPSNEQATVWAMWTDPDKGSSCDFNIGICCNDLFVADLDVKGGKDGVAAFLRVIDELGLPEVTLATKTPTGGQHRLYMLPPGTRARNTVEELGPGVDTRGWHGYVVAPGSRTEAGEYTWLLPPGDTPMATASPAAIDRCLFTGKKRDRDVVEGLELDDPNAVERATRWLKDHAPQAIEGAGGDNMTYQVACTVRDYGLEEETCLQLMLEHWNSEKAIPPWQPDELGVKVANAYSFAQNPAGARSAAADFEVVELQQDQALNGNLNSAHNRKLFWERFEEACERFQGDQGPGWLIKKYLGKGEMSVMYGDSNTGKTFVALDMAYHIATTRQWNGRKVAGGLVVYVAAEAGKGIRARLEALRRRYKPETNPSLVVVPCLVDLFSPNADLKPLLAQLEAISAAYGMPIAMVVLDTLARVIGPGDENSARDMGVLVKSVDLIRVTTEAHTMLIHHSGKNAANGARGSSALRAATDTEIEIKDGKIIMRKQRNGEIVQAVAFNLQTVELGKDVDGDTVTSCTVELGAAVDFEPQSTNGEQELEDWLTLLRFLGKRVFTRTDAEMAWDTTKTTTHRRVVALLDADLLVEVKGGGPKAQASYTLR